MTKTNQRVRVAIDAMGGDYAPEEIVKGAVAAAEKDDIEVILVGPTDRVKPELAKYDISHLPVHHVNAKDFIQEGKHPALAVRRKPNSSIAIATKMVKAGEADGLLGATTTGALVISAMRFLGMIDGVERPVIGSVLSSIAPKTAIFDLGANTDCKPHHLVTFAIIGSVYARIFLDVANPTVALLNIGKEEDKGNRLVQETYPLLEESGLNFIGSVEGSGIFSGQANVIVCDGFVGNAILKLSESGVVIIGDYLMRKVGSYPIIGRFLKGKIKKFMTSLSLPNSISGGLIWGVDGIAFKIHGHSQASDVADKLAQLKMAVEGDVVNCLKSELAKIRKKLNL
jgi:glycerol-3-phosphate acyltransferase PlsX